MPKEKIKQFSILAYKRDADDELQKLTELKVPCNNTLALQNYIISLLLFQKADVVEILRPKNKE